MKFLVASNNGVAGYWGGGKTVSEAVKAAKWLRTKDEVVVMLVDDEAYIDEFFGHVHYDKMYFRGVGKVRANGAVNLTLE
jgi:hypothetical protein